MPFVIFHTVAEWRGDGQQVRGVRVSRVLEDSGTAKDVR